MLRRLAAFVDGGHMFHNVFVGLFYLQTIVRPGGLVVLDDYWWGALWRPAISKPIWGGDRMRLRAARGDDYVRCDCLIRRRSRNSGS
jgi:hypothetical protein